jgi:hypothetical protein
MPTGRGGGECQTAKSNRMLLYRHFRLPVIGYGAGNRESLRRAAAQALALPPLPEDPDISDRDLLCDRNAAPTRAQNGVIVPPPTTSVPPARLTWPRVKTLPPSASIAQFCALPAASATVASSQSIAALETL